MNIHDFALTLPPEYQDKAREARAYVYFLSASLLIQNKDVDIEPVASLRGDNILLTWEFQRADYKTVLTAEFIGDGVYVFTKITPKNMHSSRRNLRETMDMIL